MTSDSVRDRRHATLAAVDLAAEGDLGDPVAAELAGRATGDPNPEVRQFAVEALGNAAIHRAAIERALSDDDEWVRAEAVVALSRAAGDRASDRLRAAVDDDSGWVRRNAVVALGKLEVVGPEALRERIREDPHPPVREYAAQYLGDYDDEDTVRILAAVLARDPDAFVRSRAATSLGEIGTERAIEALERSGVTDRSDDVQRAAEQALSVARGDEPGTTSGSTTTPDQRGLDASSPPTRPDGPRGGDRR